ncbi:hypothetical protein [Desmospora activa]|uniref:Uncharacterized protein n=1 Tax=Desmospora activa DSM 45169 TaxID=1121389 RepID=A0A2T4ZCB7_9BACL|nr:hypothetical protein [Desmospora activa]PTM59540.1 hypothetical protein C8J48_2164 [Desmospora activa DSM 45169]
MAKVRGKFVMGGVQAGPVLNQLEVGDQLSLIGAFGKVTDVDILESYKYDGRKVYITDKLGLIYADEVMAVSMPAWRKALAKKDARVG